MDALLLHDIAVTRLISFLLLFLLLSLFRLLLLLVPFLGIAALQPSCERVGEWNPFLGLAGILWLDMGK